jgi:hypothetical protein
VVLFVGAKLLGQASESTVVLKQAPFARKEPVFPVMATVFPNRFKSGTRTLISGLFRFRDTNDTIIILNHPKSPCIASEA